MEIFDQCRVYVLGNELIEMGILYQNVVVENEEFWNWILFYMDIFECYVVCLEFGDFGNKN